MRGKAATEFTGHYARVWLHLLKEGGWHTIKEIFTAVPIDYREKSTVLRQMCQYGYVLRRMGQEGLYEYGVTMDCRPPRSISVRDIAAMMA